MAGYGLSASAVSRRRVRNRVRWVTTIPGCRSVCLPSASNDEEASLLVRRNSTSRPSVVLAHGFRFFFRPQICARDTVPRRCSLAEKIFGATLAFAATDRPKRPSAASDEWRHIIFIFTVHLKKRPDSGATIGRRLLVPLANLLTLGRLDLFFIVLRARAERASGEMTAGGRGWRRRRRTRCGDDGQRSSPTGGGGGSIGIGKPFWQPLSNSSRARCRRWSGRI